MGTQTVFGDGPVTARLMLVGEQPGDDEDRTGRPFTGPAGQLLARALQAAGLGDEPRYVSNAVKHFNWEPRGKRRLHKRPRVEHVMACHFWLEREMAAVRPAVLVVLGATAARAVLGRTVGVLAERGKWSSAPGLPNVLVTVHPSLVLRSPDDASRQRAFAALVADLRRIKTRL